MEPHRTSGRAYVGCSGWQYKDWRGIIYPQKLAQRRWFEHYSTLFDTVEINNTFYRLPRALMGRMPKRQRVHLRGEARAVRLPPDEAEGPRE